MQSIKTLTKNKEEEEGGCGGERRQEEEEKEEEERAERIDFLPHFSSLQPKFKFKL